MKLVIEMGLTIVLLAPLWCVGQVSEMDSTRLDDYLRQSTKLMDFPEHVANRIAESLQQAEVSVVEEFNRNSFITSFDNYFDQGLAIAGSGVDSLLQIVKKGYAVSNYGWALSDNPKIGTYSVQNQYQLMVEGRYDGLCGDFSNFIANVCEYYGFPAVTIRMRIEGDVGYSEGHIFVLAKAEEDWYLLETTTGQMLLDSRDSTYLTYEELLMRMTYNDMEGVIGSEPVYGRFIQPTDIYPTQGFEWVYGTDPIMFIKKTDSLTTLSVKRSLQIWESSFAVQVMYIQYLVESGREPNWLYVYDTEYIQAVHGKPASVALYHEDGLCSITEGGQD